MQKIAVAALLAAFALDAGAQKPAPADVWFGAGHIELSASAAGMTAEWQFDRADNGDVRIVKDERRGNSRTTGTVLSVCDDQALALKDIAPTRRHELQELNEPVLNLQLVLRVLARAMPQGLPAVGAQVNIDVRDDKNTLRLRKGYSARKDITAPWRVHGLASRTANEVRFDLNLTHAAEHAGGRPSELKLTGAWAQQSRLPSLDNAFKLAGWRVYRVDTVAEVVGGNTVLDPVAVPTPLEFATLGDVRARIGRWWNPDVKAPKKAECKL